MGFYRRDSARDALMPGISFGAMKVMVAPGMHIMVDVNLQILSNARTFVPVHALAGVRVPSLGIGKTANKDTADTGQSGIYRAAPVPLRTFAWSRRPVASNDRLLTNLKMCAERKA